MRLKLKPYQSCRGGATAAPAIATVCYLVAAACLQLVAQVLEHPPTRTLPKGEPLLQSTTADSPKLGLELMNRDQLIPQRRRLEVGNLQLVPEVRAFKLSWTYKNDHQAGELPGAFLIRYCELTSWNEHIKCRHRLLQVADCKLGHQNETTASKTVIDSKRPTTTTTKTSPNCGHLASSAQLARYQGADRYEAHIYDLRAQTNYTIQVQAAQADDGQQQVAGGGRKRTAASGFRRVEAGRKLESSDTSENEVPMVGSLRLETKAFKAEATRCLSDVSEVLVNTGRHFGGRISVENSSHPRCQLLGNRTSEQSAYLFRIDHQLCKSKIMDSNRIETMVLVHENRDILTHNTARFLVICTQLQKSFTLRASVSLPKVNSQFNGSGQSRPAHITWLPSKPSGELSPAAGDKPLRLGSMPGVFRSRNLTTETPQVSTSFANNVDTSELLAKRTNELDEPNNQVSPLKMLMSAGLPEQPVLRHHHSKLASNRVAAGSANGRARSMALFSRPPPSGELEMAASSSSIATPLQPPAPVQVQSSLFYVGGRPSPATVAHQLQARSQNATLGNDNNDAEGDHKNHVAAAPAVSNSASSQSGQHAASKTPELEYHAMRATEIISTLPSNSNLGLDATTISSVGGGGAAATTTTNISAASSQHESANTTSSQPVLSYADLNDIQASPVVLTNNHNGRIAPVASVRSLHKPLAAASDWTATSGGTTIEEPTEATPISHLLPQWFATNRMGKSLDGPSTSTESLERQLLASDHHELHRNLQPPLVGDNDNKYLLAKNLTSRLLKLSLKTMGSVARKTIEMLIKGTEADHDESEGAQVDQLAQENATSQIIAQTSTLASAPVSMQQLLADRSSKGVVLNKPAEQVAPASITLAPRMISGLKPNESLQDGFLVSRQQQQSDSTNSTRKVTDRQAKTARNMGLQRGQRVLAANATSGANNNKTMLPSGREKLTKPSEATSVIDNSVARSSNNSSSIAEETRRNDTKLTYSSLPIYASILLSLTICVTLLMLWFVSATPKRSNSRHEVTITACNANFHDTNQLNPSQSHNQNQNYSQCTGSLVIIHPANLTVGQSNDGFEDIRRAGKMGLSSSSQYDRFENLSSPAASNRLSAVGSLLSSRRSSLSDGSTLILAAEETDCKTNELLFSNHLVLVGNKPAQTISGESYA